MPGHLTFQDVGGDCHIKFGHLTDSPTFAIKIATGFYLNPRLGLPSGNGVILLFDARTGAPLCLFQDGGMMTAWRTAAATALAAHCLSPVARPLVGIIGSGLQAQLTPAWTAELLPEATFVFHGRDVERTEHAARECNAAIAPSREALLATADIVITATSSHEPLFPASHARPGSHFVALGVDGPDKQELPPELFQRADIILTDDRAQCLALGDYGLAVKAGKCSAHADRPLGNVLAGECVFDRRADEISIVDLTGLAAQDIAIANWFGSRLGLIAFDAARSHSASDQGRHAQ